VTATGARFNPFPGLRPFEPDEDYLFFGREREVDELLRRLGAHRFLSVIGTSGSGKSSLVRSGLIPSLHSGFILAGSSWRVAIMRPGEDPIGRLAAALDTSDILGAPDERLASASHVVLEAALRRGTRGLTESVRLASIPPGDNLLIVVDQFEELFRFRDSREHQDSADDAAAFVKLLLEATKQQEVPIYVVITMRADFIGECMEYHGLPEALNASQYLVPRLTRDELRAAITGPVAVAGGEIAPRLVLRLLNDLGSDHDQLPVLQHALMRTWDAWAAEGASTAPMDIRHYEAIGTLKEALSRHAEEAYAEVGPAQPVAEKVFKALTDRVTDPRGIRRPCTVAALSAIAEVPPADIVRIVESFRRPGRSFLMPPSDQPLVPEAIVDLSHESLMRCWKRLIAWAEEERLSASTYIRLARAAAWFDEGTAGLWRDPQLELGLRWRRESRPTAAWASRYDPAFEQAMHFLSRSEEARDLEKAERVAMRRKQWRRLQVTALGLAALLAYAVWSGVRARDANVLARRNLEDAVRAVNESLALIDRDPSQLGIDHPDVIAIRRELAQRARGFYAGFINRGFADENLRQSAAVAHFRLAQANRVLGANDAAAEQYGEAITQYAQLVEDYPATASYRQALANSQTYLGESLRQVGRFDEAKAAYDQALGLQRALVKENGATVAFQQDLARTFLDRGILYSGLDRADASSLAEADFREAIRLLEPLARDGRVSGPRQELSRALNNLGNLMLAPGQPLQEAEQLYTRAVQTHEALVSGEPTNREYRMELAQFYNNLSYAQREQGKASAAHESNQRALALIDGLAQPPPTLAVEQADGHNLRARILQVRGWREALPDYDRALQAFERIGMGDGAEARRSSIFHERFGDLMENLAQLVRDNPGVAPARGLLTRAIDDYRQICGSVAASNRPDEAKAAAWTVSRLLAELDEPDRTTVGKSYEGIVAGLNAVRSAPGKR
jgi:tetratricopeptide (TPR) repeat protein